MFAPILDQVRGSRMLFGKNVYYPNTQLKEILRFRRGQQISNEPII